jgi:Ribosomal protein S10
MEKPSVRNKIKLTIHSYNESILKAFIHAFSKENLDDYFYGPVFLPEKKNVFCVLRSPFVNKDSRDHFELNLYSVTFYSTFSTDENLLKFLKTFFKKLSFRITNNISVEITRI